MGREVWAVVEDLVGVTAMVGMVTGVVERVMVVAKGEVVAWVREVVLEEGVVEVWEGDLGGGLVRVVGGWVGEGEAVEVRVGLVEGEEVVEEGVL